METAETSATGRILTAYKIITALSIKDQQAMIWLKNSVFKRKFIDGRLLKREIYRLKSCSDVGESASL